MGHVQSPWVRLKWRALRLVCRFLGHEYSRPFKTIVGWRQMCYRCTHRQPALPPHLGPMKISHDDEELRRITMLAQYDLYTDDDDRVIWPF